MPWSTLCATLFSNFLWSAKGGRYTDGLALDMVNDCVGQFKNSRLIQCMSMVHKTYNVLHIWNYFDTGHGKGEHDRVGACIKTALRREEMRFTRNPHIKYVEAIVQWCSRTMPDRTKVQHKWTRVGRLVRNFWHVVDIDWSCSYSFSIVQLTHGFHSVRS